MESDPLGEVAPRGPQETNRRMTLVLVSAVLGAAAIIGIVVVLTPLDENPLEEEMAKAEAKLAAAQRAAETAAATPTKKYPRVPIAQLELATEAEDIDVTALREELTGLADWLKFGYPNDASALHIAAQIYGELRQTQIAQATWEKCLEAQPMSPGPYAGLAQLLSESGNDERAVEVISDALNKGIESAELSLTLAESYENLGQLDRAAEVLQFAARRYPEDPEIFLALGRVQNQLKEYTYAESSVRRAIELGGESEPALFTLSTALVRQGKKQDAAIVQSRLNQIQKQPTGDQNQGFQENYNAAFRGIAHRVFLGAASVAEKHQAWEDAERLVRRAVRLDPDRVKSYMSLASVMLGQARMGEALAVHELLLQKQPENLLNYLNLAAVASEVGELELAESTLEDALAKHPDNNAIVVVMAKLQIKMGNFSKARQLAASVVEQNPTAETYMLLATAYEGAGELDAAKAAIERARQLDPNHPALQPMAESGNTSGIPRP